MTKPEAAAAETATSRRSNRAKPTASILETKATTTATTDAKKTKPEPETASADTVVKRGPGRPPGSTNKNPPKKPADDSPKTPGRRGRPRLVNTGDQETKKEKVVTTPGKRGRKRKLETEDSTAAKKLATDGNTEPRKRGRPAGTGKKPAAAPINEVAVAAKEVPMIQPEYKGDDDTGAFNGIKLTIERCTTCTQYHKNVVRIFKATKELYPLALTQEDVVPNSKSFEIYLSNNGSKNKLIWSGKAHAPPKRLAFPDSDVFIKLLKDELKVE